MTCRVVPDGTAYVTELGVGSSWYSDDTRTSTGVRLHGLVSSYPGYFAGSGIPATAPNDALIDQQLTFTSAAPYNTSTNGNGVLRLWSTDESAGKASVRFYNPWQGANTAPVVSAPAESALAAITAKFRWYMQPAPTQRVPAFNLLVVGPTIGSPSNITSTP